MIAILARRPCANFRPTVRDRQPGSLPMSDPYLEAEYIGRAADDRQPGQVAVRELQANGQRQVARQLAAACKAQLPRAEPVNPTWKNMPTITTTARRLSRSPRRDCGLRSRVRRGRHLEAEVALGSRNAWSCVVSQKALQARIRLQPAAGPSEIAPRPSGTSANFMPADGER
jgi:hypothetical protein